MINIAVNIDDPRIRFSPPLPLGPTSKGLPPPPKASGFDFAASVCSALEVIVEANPSLKTVVVKPAAVDFESSLVVTSDEDSDFVIDSVDATLAVVVEEEEDVVVDCLLDEMVLDEVVVVEVDVVDDEDDVEAVVVEVEVVSVTGGNG